MGTFSQMYGDCSDTHRTKPRRRVLGGSNPLTSCVSCELFCHIRFSAAATSALHSGQKSCGNNANLPSSSSSSVLSHLPPRPQNNGKFCSGSSRLNQLCNTRPCPPQSVDFRAQQCVEYNSKPFRGWYYKWKPYTKVDGRCPAT